MYAIDVRYVVASYATDLAAARIAAAALSLAYDGFPVAITTLAGAVADVYQSGVALGITAYPPGWDGGPSVVDAYHNLVLRLAPEGYWRLDALSGTVVADLTGNGHTGTLSGAVTVGQPSIVNDDGAAYLWDAAATGKIVVPHVAALDPGPSFTIVAWVDNLDRMHTGGHECLVFDQSSAVGADVTNMDFYDEGDGTTFGMYIDTSGGGHVEVDGIPFGGKHMVVIRRDDVTGHIVIKLDDATIGDGAVAAPSVPAAFTTLGAHNNGGPYTLSCVFKVDEIAFWPTTAVSDAELTALWNAGKP